MNTTTRGTFSIEHGEQGEANCYFNFSNGERYNVGQWLPRPMVDIDGQIEEVTRLQLNAQVINTMDAGEVKTEAREQWIDELCAFINQPRSSSIIGQIIQDLCPGQSIQTEEVNPLDAFSAIGLQVFTMEEGDTEPKPLIPTREILERPFEAMAEAYEKGDRRFFETTEEVYWEQLECVPPKLMGHNSFLTGEAHSHAKEDGRTVAIFAAFYRVGDRYFCRHESAQTFVKRQSFAALHAQIESEQQGAAQ